MLFTYDSESKTVVKCAETTLKEHNLMERQDLEKWVEMCPEMLGEKLLIISTEYDQFDKTSERLDLLALDKHGRLVVVELKREDSGKYVDLQAIKYAAYCSTMTKDDVVDAYFEYAQKTDASITRDDAQARLLGFLGRDDLEEMSGEPRIILVAGNFREEVTSCVMWLRKFEVDIQCVRLLPYQLADGSIVLDCSILIPLPEVEDFMVRRERKEKAEHERSVTQMEYIDFFREVAARLRKDIPGKYPPPTGKSYYKIPTGISNSHFEWMFHGTKEDFSVELHFEGGDKQWNASMLERLETVKSKIEQAVGASVVFEQDWRPKWSRLYIRRQGGEINEDLKEWAVDKMRALIQVLHPELARLATA